LENSELQVSRLAFGTATLHHLISAKARQRLLATAFENGFTHFDTAPLYGYGIAEQELGRFARGRRSHVTIATKVGLYPPPGARATTGSVLLRKAVGKVVPACNSPERDWSLDRAKRSLDTSLRRLAVDYVDLLLLHEPVSGTIEIDSLRAWLEHEKSVGRIRAFGLAGAADHMAPMIAHSRLAGVLQIRDSIVGREADVLLMSGRSPQLTYGYLSASAPRSHPEGVACTLSQAFVRHPLGSIIVSSRYTSHVTQLAHIAERYDHENQPQPSTR
jgi:aryl-alcohol dehydrogenase-like predicted oxidoreductase